MIGLNGDEHNGEFAVLKHMFSEGFDWTKSKPATFTLKELNEHLGSRLNVAAALHGLTQQRFVVQNTSYDKSSDSYRLSRAGADYLATSAIGVESGASDSFAYMSSNWTGAQFALVDAKVIAEVRATAGKLHEAVHSLHFVSNSDSQNLKGLADALVAVCSMAEPELTIIDRILASPKFKAYAGLFALVATIRGALGI